MIMVEAIGYDLEKSVWDFYKTGAPVEIETERLSLRPMQESDRSDFYALYTDPIAMQKFTDCEQRLKAKGITLWTEEQLQKANSRLSSFLRRVRQHDPFNGFAVLDKTTRQFMGMAIVGYGEKSGQSEIAFIFRRDAQGKGFATEAMTALVKGYLPALIKIHYEMTGEPLTVRGVPLSKLMATARTDNQESISVLEKLGMTKTKEIKKWGSLRGVYELKL
jgi:RimJ/RimL family protein N-acetyltransferase